MTVEIKEMLGVAGLFSALDSWDPSECLFFLQNVSPAPGMSGDLEKPHPVRFRVIVAGAGKKDIRTDIYDHEAVMSDKRPLHLS